MVVQLPSLAFFYWMRGLRVLHNGCVVLTFLWDLLLHPKTLFVVYNKPLYICNNSANEFLTILRTYRPIVAILLLTVYAFIAAPVQTWHQHKVANKTARGFPVLAKADEKADANCPVCSHKYSTYNETALVSFDTISPFIPTILSDYLPRPIAASVVLMPNKGPPALYKAIV
jgi:hypothetical protein